MEDLVVKNELAVWFICPSEIWFPSIIAKTFSSISLISIDVSYHCSYFPAPPPPAQGAVFSPPIAQLTIPPPLESSPESRSKLYSSTSFYD